MRRLLRILLNIIAALSLLLCIASTVAWVRSYRGCDTVVLRRVYRTPGILTASQYGLLWGRGTVRYSVRSQIDTWDRAELLDELESFRRNDARGYEILLNPVDWIEQSTLTRGRRSLGPIAVAHRSYADSDEKLWRANPQTAGHRRTFVTEHLEVRLWLVVLMFAAIPLVRGVRFVQRVLRRRGGRRTGLCPA
jgi:hypothetical protein